MVETEVLENPLEQAKVMAEEQTADIEQQYGGETKAKELKTKVVEKKAALPKKEIVTEQKKEEKKEAPKQAEAKAAEKKEIVTEKKQVEKKPLFDPLGETKQKAEPKSKEVNIDDLEKHPDFVKHKQASEKWNSAISNPLIKDILSAVEAGKNPLEVIADIQPMDFKKNYEAISSTDKEMADKQLSTLYYSRVEGLKGQELKDSVEEFIAAEEGNSKRRERNGYFQALDNDQSDRIGKYIETANASQKRNQDNQNQFIADIDSVIESSYKTGEPYGIKLTPEQSTELAEDSKGFFKNLFDANGKVNAKKVAFYTFAENYMRKAITDSYANGLTKGEEEILEKVHSPDPNDQSLSNAPPVQTEKSDKDRIEEQYGGGVK